MTVITKMQPPPSKKHYVNNEDFLKKLKAFRSNKKKGLVSRIPDEIAEIIHSIAVSLARSPKFNGYTYKEEMISDAVLNCLEKIDNFSPRKSNNPFAYFTQIIYFAFIRRIKGENKHSYIKNKIMQDFLHTLHSNEQKIKKKKILHYETTHESWDKLDREILEKEKRKNAKRKGKSVPDPEE
ncbi:MAG: hypothetical protein N3A54_01420 [Patescibacteria group bacterium]|nr:hypothetical protein [Patescibacteria group bacterium]